MAFRFRKSLKIAPGIRINLSKSGISTTIGGNGASVNIGKNGTYLNTGIPGTGIYSREKISGSSQTSGNFPNNEESPDKNPFPILPIIGWGCVAFLAVAIAEPLPGLSYLVAIFLLIKGIIHLFKKTKPIYSKEGVYKNDRRFKTGQRHVGFQNVKTGSIPMLRSEKRDQVILACFEIIYALYISYKAYPYLK